MTIEKNSYLSALRKSENLRDIKIHTSKRTGIKEKQDNKCAKCKKDLKPGYYSFIKNPLTNNTEIICSDCSIEIPKR